MRQIIYLPTFIAHPEDFYAFHYIIDHAIKKFPTPKGIKILDADKIEDNELTDLLKKSVVDSVAEIQSQESDITDITSFHLYQIEIESDSSQVYKNQSWLEMGLKNIFKDLKVSHVGYFFYLIDEGRNFRILNFGHTIDYGFFDHTDAPEELDQFDQLQEKAEYFKSKWYK
jgi:hypothetical protein